MSLNSFVKKCTIYYTLSFLILELGPSLAWAQGSDGAGKGTGPNKNKGPKRIPRPKPVRASTWHVPPSMPASNPFAVDAPDENIGVVNPCEEFSDPCKCASDPKCEFNEMTKKCIRGSPKFANKLSCRRANAFYAFNSAVLCPNKEATACPGAMSIYSVNLNGIMHIDNAGNLYKPEASIIKMDTGNLNTPVTGTCSPTGIASDADRERLYQKYIEGDPKKRDEGSCVSYPIPLLQNGEYELTIKTVSGAGGCMDIKLGGAIVADDLDLTKLAGGEDCKGLDIVILFLVDIAKNQMYIKGHQSPVGIHGGFSLKFCFAGCAAVKDSTYRASAFSLIRFGEDSKVFEDMELNIKQSEDGSLIFTSINMMVRTYEKYQIKFEDEHLESNLANKSKDKAKLQNKKLYLTPHKKLEREETQKVACPSFAKNDLIGCKKAFCEYNLVTGECNSAKMACAGASLGDIDCFRANSYYMTDGVLCKTAAVQEGTCDLEEVKFAINLYGDPYRDVNGIDYSSWNLAKADNFDSFNLANATTKCREDEESFLKITGGASADTELFATVVSGKGSTKEELIFTVENLDNGAYELSVKTLEPFHSDPAKRAFSIKINEETVISNLDIAFYSGVCVGMDIVIQFKVIDGVIQLPGVGKSKREVPIAAKTLLVAFVYGDEGMGYEDLSFIVGAMYVVKFKVKGQDEEPLALLPDLAMGPKAEIKQAEETSRDDEPTTAAPVDDGEDDETCAACEEFHENPQGCKGAGFEYNFVDHKCLKLKKSCKTVFDEELQQCRRKNVIYVSKGAGCISQKDTGNCGMAEVIHSLNFNGDHHDMDDRGYDYKAEDKFVVDPEGIRSNETYVGKCVVDKVSKKDSKLLYSSYIYGKDTAGSCISFDVRVCQEGSYEILVKMTDILEPNNRCFDMRIDDTPIYVGADISRLAGGKTCTPVDIAFPLEVENYGSSDVQMVTVEGHADIIFIESKFQLKFCHCEWESPNPFFQASAFAFIRYGDGAIPCDVCNIWNGEQENCDERGCEYDPEKNGGTKCVYKEKPNKICSQHNGNGNACRQQGCQYNTQEQVCDLGLSMGGARCDVADWNDYGKCVRSKAFYSRSCSLCVNMKGDNPVAKDTKGCAKAETIWAINLNGDNFTSRRGINYMEENPHFVNDPLQLRMPVNLARFCSDKDQEFLTLFGTGISGNPAKAKEHPESCVSYLLPLIQDGSYELSVIFVDGMKDEVNKRCFDIKLQGLRIGFAVDPVRMGGFVGGVEGKKLEKCTRNEFIYSFKVVNNGTELMAMNRSSPILLGGTIELSFCFGKCGYADPVFQVSAFSLIRFGGGALPVDRCSVFSKNPFACQKYDCEYDDVAKKCWQLRSEAALFCRGFSDSPCDCFQNDCRYIESRKRCVVEDPAFIGKLSCRRPRNHIAFNANLICKFPEGTLPPGKCHMGSTIYGVNAQGKDYMDSYGLKYKAETPEMRSDPMEIRKIVHSKGRCKLPWLSFADSVALYKTIMFGNPRKMKTGSCIAYIVPLKQDGEYELIIKMVDEVWKKEGHRCFDLKINDIPIATDLDLVKLEGSELCGAVDMSVLFLIENNRKTMRIKGHSNPIPIDGGFHLQFCYGKGCPKVKDKGFLMSAFSVVRFGEDTQVSVAFAGIKEEEGAGHVCQDHGGDQNACKKFGCEFDLVTKTCKHTVKECPEELFTDFSKCQRAEAFYSKAGVNCISRKSDGDCSGTTVIAWNINGQDYTYFERQIEYKAETDAAYIDESGLRTPDNDAEHCKHKSSELFYNLVASEVEGSKEKSVGCLTYPIPITEDGAYELSMFAVDGNHKLSNMRCYDIQMNDLVVLSSVDPVRLGGKSCNQNEFIILFKVTGGGKQFQAVGFPDPVDIADGKINVQFCYGKCDYAKDKTFEVSAISVFKFKQVVLTGDPCEAHGPDMNACKLSGCEFDLVKKTCVPKMKDCPDEMFPDSKKCRRENAVYGSAGILCLNKVQAGVCSGPTVAPRLALNMNGEDYTYREILYKMEGPSVYDDPQKIYHRGNLSASCPDKQDEVFLKFFSGVLTPPEIIPPQGCLHFPFRVFDDGDFEISIFSNDGQHKEPNKRNWDLRINQQIVLFAVDSYKIRQAVCVPNELVILFNVRNYVTELIPEGWLAPIPFTGEGLLSFCLASTKVEDPRFIISALSILRLETSASYHIAAETIVNPCSMHGENAKACKKANCEFNLVLKQCVSKILPCKEEEFGDFEKCRRAGASYASAGVLCKNKDASEEGTCDGQPTLALNLAGKDHTYRNIKYTEELDSDFTDETKSRIAHNFDKFCRRDSRDEHFKKFYSTGIIGEIAVATSGCVKYEIPLDTDGVYELSVFGTEPHYKYSGKRCFDIMLNFLTILYGVDHHAISGRTCGPNEMVILFKVEQDGTSLVPLGFNEGIDIDGSVELSFCFGTCGFADNSYLVSAFSVHRFGEPAFKMDPSDICAKHNGKPCACKKAGCEYHTPYQLCLATPTVCHDPPSGCKRANTWYVDGGVMCKVAEQSGNCKVEKNMMAVNMGGPEHTSVNRITYAAYADVPSARTPEGVVEGNEAQTKVPDEKTADLPLYQTFIAGRKGLPDPEADEEDCLRYDVPITKAGFYELIIKFGDFESTKVGQKTVNYKFNGVYIVQELDMFKYTGNQYGVADLVIDFVVNGDGNALTMPGHGRSVINGGVVPLEFCYGGCSPDKIPNAEWHVSAWAVVKLPDHTTTHAAR